MPSLGRPLLTLVAILTSFGGYIADWNETHIYNPRWPPHAKFHNGQTLSMGLLLDVSALFYLLRPSTSVPIDRELLHFSALLTSLYWITQLTGVLYPGALAMDPEFGEGFTQVWFCGGFLCMVYLGTTLEIRALKRREGKGKAFG